MLLVLPPAALAQRLPANVVPEHYEIAVQPNLGAASFAGSERISVNLLKPSRTITLNAAEIEFSSVTVTAAGRIQTASVSLDPGREQATFTVPRTVDAGPAEIHVKYTGTLNDQLRGLYLSKANNRRYAVTQLEATDARRMFPSFDEPAFKATFALTATIDSGDIAISNGAVVSDAPGPAAGKHTVTFETTPRMSTYLVLAVGDFECASTTADGIPIRICSTPDKKGQTGLALEAAAEILRYFNGYYSVKYPFKKLDVVAVPDFAAGAMENTAAIFYRETLLLADPAAASVSVRKDIASVLAHEIAHQWFGDLVTMRWWDDIWLNEGFATWMSSKPLKAWKPEWHVELDDVQSHRGAMTRDALHATRPLRAKASTPAEINELFDGIAYMKGAAVLRMIEAWVGEEAFRAGVNAYIERFSYGNATAEDFWRTLAASTGKPVDRVMSGFVDQAGVPIVEVDVKCAGDRAVATVTQDRFIATPGGPATAPSGLWSIPVCLRTARDAITCDVLSTRTGTVPLESCPAWLMANAGGRGYYRVGNTAAMLRSLAANLDPLTPADRIVLLTDEWALVRAGRHDVGSFLDLATGFRGETNATVVQALLSPLRTIGNYLTTPGSRAGYKAWLERLLTPSLEHVGWLPSGSESDESRELRASLVSALGQAADHPDAIARARTVVLQELAAPGSTEATLLNAAVAVAARHGDAGLYEKYLARSKGASTPEEHDRYMYALAAFRDPALVSRTMELILGPDVRSQDAKLFLAAFLRNPDARDRVWGLLREQWGQLQRKTGEAVGNAVVVTALGPSAIPERSTKCDSSSRRTRFRTRGARSSNHSSRSVIV
ncbi:MAG: M1 family metallopeptidase [Acidobacteriota bacterium]|nr:M1 family metallopeptidase [Acidobacteriota bacterium]